ncbi:MAG: gamma-glutamyltransferase family protein [Chromatiales bacterium]|nr:gamma-glutamyltransferase family protein [Chromatiales bacterium]
MRLAWDRPAGPAGSSRSVVAAPRAMIATSQPLATAAGLGVLQAGGSAVDAAIAANAVQCVVEPTGAGLGGDLMALFWPAGARRPVALNAGGRSPGRLLPEAFSARGLTRIPPDGPLSISVPGAVDGWRELHQRWGRLPLPALLEPAIHYASEGFPVGEIVAGEWAENAGRLAHWPGFAETFLPDGAPPVAGTRFRNPALAATLRTLAHDGLAAFYRGPIAAALEAFLQRHDGFLTAADLAAHRSEWGTPLGARYRDCEVWELPPPTQGAVVLQMLNILQGFPLAGLGPADPDWLHLLVESKKLAWADRQQFYADPSCAEVPLARLLDPVYASALRQRIHPARPRSPDPSGAQPVHGDTVAIVVADADGHMLSLMQSNYHGMGSGLVPPELGFPLQNRGELFSLDPAHPNAYAPGKRPFHTVIPAMIGRAGLPWLAFGFMGADMQAQGQVQLIANLVDFRMPLQQAVDAPRLNHVAPRQAGDPPGGTVCVEDGILAASGPALAARGHDVAPACGIFGGCQAVARDPEQGCWLGASDPRKDGHAAGF